MQFCLSLSYFTEKYSRLPFVKQLYEVGTIITPRLQMMNLSKVQDLAEVHTTGKGGMTQSPSCPKLRLFCSALRWFPS